jgi:hypothetical protein
VKRRKSEYRNRRLYRRLDVSAKTFKGRKFMDRSEKSQVLLERAEKLPLRLESDSGLQIVKRMEEADGTSSACNDEPKSDQPRKGIFELFRRSSAGSSVERDRS